MDEELTLWEQNIKNSDTVAEEQSCSRLGSKTRANY